MHERPIVDSEQVAVNGYQTVTRKWSYDELLTVFGNDGIVPSLVKRCREYEAMINKLRKADNT